MSRNLIQIGLGRFFCTFISSKSELARISKQKFVIGFEFCFISKMKMIILIKLFHLFDFACHGEAHWC